MSKRITARYRCVFNEDGEPLDGFVDENGVPLELGDRAVTYTPDHMVVETDFNNIVTQVEGYKERKRIEKEAEEARKEAERLEEEAAKGEDIL